MAINEQLFTLKKPIVLIGMMGSGKSTIGRRLAGTLKIDFHDSDSIIEEQTGQSIPEIFSRDGESAFRQHEQEVILNQLTKGLCVISTGGGAIMNPVILSAIKAKAISIWLKADISEILRRVGKSKKRPLLQTVDPEKTLSDLLRDRGSFYNQADITIDTTGGNINLIVPEIIKTLSDKYKADSF
jgi:shikimate kinase